MENRCVVANHVQVKTSLPWHNEHVLVLAHSIHLNVCIWLHLHFHIRVDLLGQMQTFHYTLRDSRPKIISNLLL